MVARIDEVIGELDEMMRQIRRTIADLGSESGEGAGFRRQITEMVSDAAESLEASSSVEFAGPVDGLDSTIARPTLEALATLLSRVRQPAAAQEISVTLTIVPT